MNGHGNGATAKEGEVDIPGDRPTATEYPVDGRKGIAIGNENNVVFGTSKSEP